MKIVWSFWLKLFYRRSLRRLARGHGCLLNSTFKPIKVYLQTHKLCNGVIIHNLLEHSVSSQHGTPRQNGCQPTREKSKPIIYRARLIESIFTSFIFAGTQMYLERCLGGWSLCLRLVLVKTVKEGFKEAHVEEESGHWR